MTCRLCKENRTLMKSHIFPEWLYTPLYDKSHRFFVLSTNKDKKRGTRPKGIYERLLCQECEAQLSKWEGYARSVFYRNDPRLNIEDCGNRVVLSGLRYNPFKLFQMSLIWRASVTNRREVRKINLGPHAERLRKMLIDECPGEIYQYGSILMLPPPSLEGIMAEFLYPPECIPTKLDGHTAYRAAFGGLFWLFIVSNHSERVPNDIFLSKNGRLPIFKVGRPAETFMQQFGCAFSAAGMLDEPA